MTHPSSMTTTAIIREFKALNLRTDSRRASVLGVELLQRDLLKQDRHARYRRMIDRRLGVRG